MSLPSINVGSVQQKDFIYVDSQPSYYRLKSCLCGYSFNMSKDIFISIRSHLTSKKCATLLEKPWSNTKIVERFGEKIDRATSSWYTEHVKGA
jgi:hypothetical protein